MAAPPQLPVKTQLPAAVGAGKSGAGASSKGAAGSTFSIPPALSGNWMEFGVPIAVLGIVLAMIAPLPPFCWTF